MPYCPWETEKFPQQDLSKTATIERQTLETFSNEVPCPRLLSALPAFWGNEQGSTENNRNDPYKGYFQTPKIYISLKRQIQGDQAELSFFYGFWITEASCDNRIWHLRLLSCESHIWKWPAYPSIYDSKGKGEGATEGSREATVQVPRVSGQK